ncbi:RNA-binding domain-containing protein [Phellopilus nigrolimitatus]|nr:RNA-binding domain-containing protein [Phellopilus nigrolimitatus]
MAPSNAGGAISIPTAEVNMSNGNGLPVTGDDQSWAPGSALSPRPGADGPPRRSRSRSPVAREGGDRGGREPGSTNPGNNLHVSGLSTKVDSRELEAAFAKVGRVQKASVMYDPHSRESRGFGFVTMETPEEADAAITALNSTELFGNGKAINVERARRARARTPTPGRYYGPPKRGDHERPYDPRPYDDRYSRNSFHDDRDRDRRGGGRYDDRGDRGDRGGRRDDRDRDRFYDRRYDDRRYDDKR